MLARMIWVLLLVGFSTPAAAWWDGAWKYRRAVEVDVSTLAVAEPVAAISVPVRLHTGNFAFSDASESGSDLRFVAMDDATPLPFYIERYDRENELAIAWVRIAGLGGGAPQQRIWLYYGNEGAQPASDPSAIYDIASQFAFHYHEADALPQDASALRNSAVRSSAATIPGGVVGDAVRFTAQSQVLLPRSPSLALAEGGRLTFSTWLRLSSRSDGTIYSHLDGARGVRLVVRNGGRLQARVDRGAGEPVAVETADPLELDRWYFVTLAGGEGSMALLLNGVEVARASAVLPALAGTMSFGAGEGAGFVGELDQTELSSEVRPVAWSQLSAALQAPDSTMVNYGESVEEGAGRGYLAILRVIGRSVSTDGWIIVAIIAVLGVLSGEVMWRKQRMLRRIAREDGQFLHKFESLPLEALQPAGHAMLGQSTAGLEYSALAQVCQVGLGELGKVSSLLVARGRQARMSPEIAEVIRAAIEGEIGRQVARMNREMVMLTLAVSGAPFLGLLGTVVGIMVTFGAITLSGDVNVNTIAPGVAAALVTTVAGLAVAIPVMFGYNRLATTIRDLTGSLETFANDLLARITIANLD